MKLCEISKENERILDEIHLEFKENIDCDLEEKRGYPVDIQVNQLNSIDELRIWADISGINCVVNWCLDKVELFVDHSLGFDNSEIVLKTGSCVYDVLTNGAYTTVDDEVLVSVDGRTVVYESEKSLSVFEARKNCVYPDAKEIIYVSDAVGDKLRTEALLLSLEKVCGQVEFTQDDYFIYTVPDALEEFSQKKLKQCVKSWFPRSFPVWRSVDSLTELLYFTDDSFKEMDMFLSLDLMGEVASAGLLMIKSEKEIQGYVCNHYLPFPEKDSGELLTERTFQLNYLERYVSLHNYEIEEHIKDEIVKSGIIQKVLRDKSNHNFSYCYDDLVCIIGIEYDEKITVDCKNEWLVNLCRFWNEIKVLVPSGTTIQYINILNDVIMDIVSLDEVKDILGTHESFVGVYCSVNKHINKGAYVYLDRIRNHKPTWTEYLPELSLEVIKDGQYD